MDKKLLYKWCSIPASDLPGNAELKIPFRMVETSEDMGLLMARELADEIISANQESREYRAIIPCGPKCWYAPFAEIVNRERISLRHVTIFHMDECLDWQGQLLAHDDPYNFRTFMEKFFYGPIDPMLSVPEENRFFLSPSSMETIREKIWDKPIDLTLGGWGQDGHIAYNQSRREVYSLLSIDELRKASIRIQNNNYDTILALAHRTFGSAFQFVPPMSITLGIKECLSAKKVRLFSDTGAWKQTALRVALFSDITSEYPITLLQEHSDALLTATRETATHPISENPDWVFAGVNDQ